MTPEGFHPVGFSQTEPNCVGCFNQRAFITNRSFLRHAACPSVRTATHQYLASSLLLRQLIPATEHFAHVFAPSAASLFKNSATRLPATAPRYREVDRISSMGRISFATFFLTVSTSDGSIFFPVSSRSVSGKRIGVGATLPSARRTSRIVPPASWPRAARHTFEMACALRAPTFRACETYPENRRGSEISRINSSAARAVCL